MVADSGSTVLVSLPMSRLIDRYIAREILVPLLIGFFAFNGIILVGRLLRLTDLIAGSAIPFSTVMQLIGFLLPSFFMITLPMSYLLAVLLAFGRLSADSEITALKASGIGLHRLLLPVLGIAALCAAATLFTTLVILPAATGQFKALLTKTASEAASLAIKPGEFNDRIPGVVLYCREYDPDDGTMSGIILQDERSGKDPLTVFAGSGSLQPSEDRQTLYLDLSSGSIHQRSGAEDYRLIGFSRYHLSVPLSKKKESFQDETEMTLTEMQSAIKAGTGTPKFQTDLRLELQKRFAFPAVCFIFALIGMSLGIQQNRSGKGSGFTISLLVFVSYYILFSATKSMGQKHLLHPAAAIWLPNAFFLVLGVLLFMKTARESKFSLPRGLRVLLFSGRKK